MENTSTFVIPVPESLSRAKWEGFTESWCDHKLEKAEGVQTGDGFVWVRKVRTPNQLYAVAPDASKWQCAKCGNELLSARVAHAVHDGPFPLSGSGRCEYEEAPYCPQCEPQPRFDGSFITIGHKF